MEYDPREETEEEPTLGMRRLLSAVGAALGILGRRWIIVAAIVVLSVAGMLAAISRMTPYYRAKTTIVINTASPQVLDQVRGVNEEELWSPSAYSEFSGTQKEIIKSRTVSELALADLGLAEDPVFLGISGLEEPERSKAKNAIDPVARLQGMISVGNVTESRVVWIAVEYPDAAEAARIVNAVREAYLGYVNEDRSETGRDAKVKLEGERVKAREALRDAEKALDEFKEDNEITSISLADRQNLITQSITKLTSKSKDAEADRIAAESVYSEAKKLSAEGSDAVASLVPPGERLGFDDLLEERLEAEREFDTTKSKYLPKMPEYRRAEKRVQRIEKRVADAKADMMKALKARRRVARSNEGQLKAALKKEKANALELGRLEPEYRELERDVTTADDAYVRVANRDEEIGLTNRVESRPPIAKLDDATEPTGAVRPRRTLLLALSLIGGLALGGVFAIVVDLRDQRIRTVADLSRAVSPFGLPVLGQLPFLPLDPALGAANIRAQRRHRDLHTFMQPQSRMAERVRGIRTALSFSVPKEPLALLVTSPGSGEGKSSTAANLAQSYCQAGKRVVLIDADMRRPRLHHLFPPTPDEHGRGIEAVLQEKITVDEGVRRELEDGPPLLSVMTCHTIPENPAELLDSAACRRMISELRGLFDVIIIDSPPTLRVTDPLILAPQVDGVVLVARCKSTQRSEMQQTVSTLQQANTNLLGIVLNHADSKSEKGSYGHGYGYGYGYAYAPDEYVQEAEPA